MRCCCYLWKTQSIIYSEVLFCVTLTDDSSDQEYPNSDT
jgi:hypothetical protein